MPDTVSVEPEVGWVRTHTVLVGQGQNGNALVKLDSDSVRVPVLVNRTITFREPGHYEVTLMTDRLRLSESPWQTTSLDECHLCLTTNAVGIDISPRDETEESAVVASLSRELEASKTNPPGIGLSAKQKEQLAREVAAQQRTADSSEASKKQQEALLQKMNDLLVKDVAHMQQQEDAQRQATVRLACLVGDEAVRVKVRFIVADEEDGGGNEIGLIMVDGLPSSRNKQLQLSLLEAAWRDPSHVPTGELQNALREAKELTHQEWVTDEGAVWAGTAEDRKAALKEYQGEIDEIIASLPLRNEQNRAQTISFLKTRGVPNQFTTPATTSVERR